MSSAYLGKKSRAKAILERAIFDTVVENPIHFESEKTYQGNVLNPFQRQQKVQLLRKSSEQSFKQKETVNSRYLSLTTATCVKPHVEVIVASEEKPS